MSDTACVTQADVRWCLERAENENGRDAAAYTRIANALTAMLPVCEAAARYYVANYHGDEDAKNDAWTDVSSFAIGVLEYLPADFRVESSR